MLSYVVICAVALLVSMLTLVSGFGLGTLLLPAFAAFFPIGMAVAATAVVHLANNIIKVALVGRHARAAVVLRFAAGALPAAMLGAWMLTSVGTLDPIVIYQLGEYVCVITPLTLIVGAVLVAFACIEFLPNFETLSFPPKLLPLGGAISGFFGGLTGMQGALRSAFLIRCGLSKEEFVGTGAVVSTLIDLTRLSIYLIAFRATTFTPVSEASAPDTAPGWPLIAAACLAAFIGSYFGSLIIKKITIATVKVTVAVALGVCGVLMMAGVLKS